MSLTRNSENMFRPLSLSLSLITKYKIHVENLYTDNMFGASLTRFYVKIYVSKHITQAIFSRLFSSSVSRYEVIIHVQNLNTDDIIRLFISLWRKKLCI